jgi:hypothetical protein
MWTLDVVITNILTGLYLFIGIMIGRHLKPSQKQPLLSVNGDSHEGWDARLKAAQDELARQLGRLMKVQHNLRSAPDTAKSVESLRLLLEQIIQAVKQSQQAVRQVNPRVEAEARANQEPVTDAAGLAAEKWFPVIAEQGEFQGREQRTARRFPYDHVQPVAPATDDTMPDESEFFAAQFRDISTTGFSFFVPDEFPADRLVARLGTEPDVVTVLAEVVRQHEVWHAGKWVYQVGCRILRRLSPRKPPTQVDRDVAVSAPQLAEV